MISTHFHTYLVPHLILEGEGDSDGLAGTAAVDGCGCRIDQSHGGGHVVGLGGIRKDG